MRTQLIPRGAVSLHNPCAAAAALFVALLCISHVSRVAADPTNSLKFSETYSDKIICAKESNDLACATVGRDQFAITAKVLLSGADITSFTYTTAFSFNLGGLHLTNQLGHDPRYIEGKKSAKFLLITRDAEGKTLVSYLLNLRWNETLLSVTIVARTTDITTSGWNGITATTFAGTPSGEINGTVDGSVSLDGVVVDFPSVPVSGTVGTKDKTAKDGTTFTVSKVVIKGRS